MLRLRRLRLPVVLAGVLALWVLLIALLRLPLVQMDAALQQAAWQFPHIVRIPITFAFVGLTLWQWLPGTRRDGFWASRSVFIVLLVLTVLCCRWNTLPWYERISDESESIVAARTLLEDSRFWISADVGTHGPLVSVWQTLLPRVGFVIDYASSRLLGAAMLCVAVLASFHILRRAADEATARLLALPLVFAVAALNTVDLTAYNGEHPILLLGMLSAVCAVVALMPALPASSAPRRASEAGVGERSPTHLTSRSLGLLFLAGLFAGGINWAKNQGIPLAFGLATATLISCWAVAGDAGDTGGRRRGALIRCAFYAAGLVTPTVAILLWTTATGALKPMYESYFLWNLAYAGRSKDANSLSGMIASSRWAVTALATMSRFMAIFLLSVPVGWLLFLKILKRRSPGVRPPLGLMAAVAWIGILGWFSVVKPGNPSSHYLLLVLFPFLLLNLLAWAFVFQGELSPSGPYATSPSSNMPVAISRKRLPAAGITYAVLAVFLPLIVWGFLPGPHGGGGCLVTPFQYIPNYARDLVERTRLVTRPEERVAIWGWMPSIYVVSQRRPASRTSVGSREAMPRLALHEYFLDLWLSDFDQSQPVVFIDEVRVKQPTPPGKVPPFSLVSLIYTGIAARLPGLPPMQDKDFLHERYPEVARRIRANYRLLYTNPNGIRFYVRNDRFEEAARLTAGLSTASTP